MPDRAVGAAEAENVIAGQRSFLDEQLAHRDHLPFDLLAFSAAIVVLAGRRIRIDLGDLEHAALLPGLRQLATLGTQSYLSAAMTRDRSEERRVGKEGRER